MTLREVQVELERNEQILGCPRPGDDPSLLLAEEFWEVGASGRRYPRAEVLAALARRQRDPEPELWQTEDMGCRELAPGLYLLSYALLQAGHRRTRRMTLWRRHPDGGWQAEYHQGTPTQRS